MLQYGHALRLLQYRCYLIGKFLAPIAGGPALPIQFTAPFAQNKPVIGVVAVGQTLSRDKSCSFVGTLHRLARQLFIGGQHAVGNTTFDQDVNHGGISFALILVGFQSTEFNDNFHVTR